MIFLDIRSLFHISLKDVTAHRAPYLCGVSFLAYLCGHADLRMTYMLRQPACEKLQHPVSSYKISGLRK